MQLIYNIFWSYVLVAADNSIFWEKFIIFRVSGKKFTGEILNKIRNFVCTHLIFA